MTPFWSYQPLVDVLYSATALSWVVALAFVVAIPGLAGVVVGAYHYGQDGRVGFYVSRFVPYIVGARIVELSNALSGATILLSLTTRLGLIETHLEHSAYWLWLGLFAGGIMLLYCIGNASYAVWSTLYMGYSAGSELRRDYFVLDLVRALLLLPLTLVCLSGVSPQVCGWILLGLLLTIQILRIARAVSRLRATSGGYIYIFLYLCTHEILPWIYVALLVGYESEVDWLQSIDK